MIKKTLQKVGIEGNYLKILKAIYNKPTVDMIVNGVKLKAFPQSSGISQACTFSQLIFNIVLED